MGAQRDDWEQMRDDVAGNLRDYRANAKVSLSRAAELTGVSKAMLGQIERGDSSPTIATLWKIAQGFQLPLGALIQQRGVQKNVDRSRSAQQGTVQFPGSIAVQIVFAFDAQAGAETFQITLRPNQTHESQSHEVGMIEEVFVLEGAMDVLHAGEWVSLAIGQGIRFAADQPHGYRSGAQGARFLNMHHYAKPGKIG